MIIDAYMKPVTKQIQIKSGFYPSFLYLPVPPAFRQQPFIQQLRLILSQSGAQFQEVEQLHLSLSKTFHPVFQEIKGLVAKFKDAINQKRIRLPVVLLVRRVVVLQNFVVAEVESVTAQRLKPMVAACQAILHQPFYQEPVFHVSLFKVLSEVGEGVVDRLLSVEVGERRSWVLGSCCLRAGKVVHLLCG